MSIRIEPEDKTTLRPPGPVATSAIKDLFSASNQERLYGVLGVLFNETRTQLLHQSELATVPDSNFLRFVLIKSHFLFTFLFHFFLILANAKFTPVCPEPRLCNTVVGVVDLVT